MAGGISRRRTIQLAAGAGIAAFSPPAFAREPGSGTYDVAVVGAGVFGAWTATMLQRRGYRVVLVDQYGPANARASSAGESRVIRLSYGGDSLYSDMAWQSLGEWQVLSHQCALPIFHPTGVLWFAPSGDEYMDRSLAWLAATRRRYWHGDSAALRTRYPQMRFSDGESGFLELETGALIAGRAVMALAELNRLPLVTAKVAAPRPMGDGTYEICDGLTARHAVYACGPWLGQLFPEELAGRIVPTRQEVLHFGVPAGDRRFAAPSQPVWADFNGGDIVYGLPDLEQQGFKFAFDRHGPVVDPDTQDRRVSPDTVAQARAYLARRFPDLADAPVVHSRVCQYENTSNGDLLIDRLPGHERVWLVGGGSGHGFKHGPAVGERLARHIADAGLLVEPRFSLATKATVAARSVF